MNIFHSDYQLEFLSRDVDNECVHLTTGVVISVSVSSSQVIVAVIISKTIFRSFYIGFARTCVI